MTCSVLITNAALSALGGTELSVRDVSVELVRRGYRVGAFSTRLGTVAQQMIAQGVEVVDDLTRLSFIPDFIYGQHFLETMIALVCFPQTPALFHCHGLLPWEETPPVHPRIRLYVATGMRGRKKIEAAVPEPRPPIEILTNYYDEHRFTRMRPGPAPILRRAVIYNRYMSEEQAATIVEACRLEGISCTTFRELNPPVTHPEDLLPEFDLVFAVGKSAIEAMAIGAAVILCADSNMGELVDDENLEKWRALNFSCAFDGIPITAESVRQQLRKYDPVRQSSVARRIRESATLRNYVDRVEQLIRQVIAVKGPCTASAESDGRLAIVRHLQAVCHIAYQLANRAVNLQKYADDLTKAYERLQREPPLDCIPTNKLMRTVLFRMAGRLRDRKGV